MIGYSLPFPFSFLSEEEDDNDGEDDDNMHAYTYIDFFFGADDQRWNQIGTPPEKKGTHKDPVPHKPKL